jgi:hypothetical protein
LIGNWQPETGNLGVGVRVGREIKEPPISAEPRREALF